VQVNRGLAELTRYYLLANQLQPQTLFEHCDPPSLEGLFSGKSTHQHRTSQSSNVTQAVNGNGWDYVYIYGNCLLTDVRELWFREDVQRYISLVVSSGGHFRFRWNEQAVESESAKPSIFFNTVYHGQALPRQQFSASVFFVSLISDGIMTYNKCCGLTCVGQI